MAFPNSIKLNAQQLGNQLHIGPLLVEPRPGVYLLMDVGSQNFRQFQFINDRIETLRIGIAAVRCALNDKEMDVRCELNLNTGEAG